jgi:hypothetical protein
MARWNSCNILHLAPDAKRLWQFEAKGGGFALAREQRTPHTEKLPAKGVTKSWGTYFQPRLNIAWLPLESVFLRTIELPAANAEETYSMVELQLEKLSPIPLTQAVWTLHALGAHHSVTRTDGTTESLQTVVVVIAVRSQVEEFLGRLEREGFMADRIEVPMLDQLEAIAPQEDGTWIFPLIMGGQNAALLAWWYGGALRSLSLITLPAAGDRVLELRNQISLLTMAGEMDGWLNAPPRWHLVADPVNATEWEGLLQGALNEPVRLSPPLAPADLAARTARRAANATVTSLLPPEFAGRYHQQFVDRLWLRGLGWVGVAYVVYLLFYFSAVGVRSIQTTRVESAVAAISQEYTNTIQLKARYEVLQRRETLKFAGLDCWRVVAEQMPAGIQLQRLSFTDGQRLSLSGSTSQDLVSTLLDFDSTIRKVKNSSGEQIFDPQKGEHVNPRTGPNNSSIWSCSLELVKSEGGQQ